MSNPEWFLNNSVINFIILCVLKNKSFHTIVPNYLFWNKIIQLKYLNIVFDKTFNEHLNTTSLLSFLIINTIYYNYIIINSFVIWIYNTTSVLVGRWCASYEFSSIFYKVFIGLLTIHKMKALIWVWNLISIY